MRTFLLLGFSCLFLLVGGNARAEDRAPEWAYPVNPPDFKPVPDDGSIRRVPDSTAGCTLSQVRDLFAAPDWHPDAFAQLSLQATA